MIYVVGADNTLHFSRLSKILELMDMSDLVSRLEPVHFSEVSQMSKKLGHGHLLSEILDQSHIAMQHSLKANPEKAALLGGTEEAVAAIGITALLSQELSARKGNDHAFDIDKMTSFEAGTGPDIEWRYAKLCSILKNNPRHTDLSEEDYASFEEEEQSNLLRLLVQYPDITQAAYKNLESATIMTYIITVADQLSTCLEEDPEGNNVTPARAMLYEATRIVLENGMKLLGIVPVTK
jgi:arginyl-tRNA synthetase